MCFPGKVGKVLDPGGYIAEKTTPKAFAPLSGLHGTSEYLKAKQTPKPAPPLQPAAQKLLGE